MIYYLPDMIYNIVKDNKYWKDLMDKIEHDLDFAHTLKDFYSLSLTSVETFKVDIENVYQYALSEVRKNCPQYEIILNLCCYKYEAEEIPPLFGLTTDIDTRISICTHYIDMHSTEVDILIEYSKKLIDIYESDPDKIPSLTQYSHTNYLKAKGYVDAYYLGDKKPSEIIKELIDIHDKIAKFDQVSHDILESTMVEVLTDAIQFMNMNEVDPNLVMAYVQKIYEYTNRLQFQYQDYCYGKCSLLYNMAICAAAQRDYNTFLNANIELASYINNMLKDIKTCIRGMNYFDNLNVNMLICLIRWIIKVSDIPIFDRNKLLLLPNLSMVDYNFAMENIYDHNNILPVVKKEYCDVFQNNIDSWFRDTNLAYNTLMDM